MTLQQLREVLAIWDGNLEVIDRDDRVVRGARIVETKDGPKVKLG